MLDPDVPAHFSPTFAASLAVSTLTAALALVGFDAGLLASEGKDLQLRLAQQHQHRHRRAS